MKNACEINGGGFLIVSDGFQVKVEPDGAGGVYIAFTGKPPRQLKYVIEKHKHLFVSPDLARTLICSEINRL